MNDIFSEYSFVKMIVHKSKKLKNQQEWGRRQGHATLKLKVNKVTQTKYKMRPPCIPNFTYKLKNIKIFYFFYFSHGFKETKTKWNKNIVRKKVCNVNNSNQKQILKA